MSQKIVTVNTYGKFGFQHEGDEIHPSSIMKPNKESYQSFILSELEKGTERGKCLAKFVKKWQMSERTFDRQWKIANSRHLEAQQERQKQLADLQTDADKERLKMAILSKDEALELLTKTAKGQPRKEGDKVVPSFAESTNAIKMLSDLQGWNSPIKSELTGPDGKPIQTEVRHVVTFRKYGKAN